MDDAVKFEVVTTCAGIEFSYRAGETITLGLNITEETATDLLRAGHIRRIDNSPVIEGTAVERATVAPPETADQKFNVRPRGKKPTPTPTE